MIDTSKWYCHPPATREKMDAVIKTLDIPPDDPMEEAAIILTVYTMLIGNFQADVVLKRHNVLEAEGYAAAYLDALEGAMLTLKGINTVVKARLNLANAN